MYRRTMAAMVMLAAAAPTLLAQATGTAPACAGQGQLEDACQKAADLFAFVAPQVAVSIAGGNAVLGHASTLGGPGRFSIGVRATGLRGELPDVGSVGITAGPAQADEFAVDEQWFGLPQVDATVGLFGGIPLALTRVGGVDLLVSGSWIPEVDEGDFSLRAPDGQFKLGYGARVGILEESFSVPGVSVTYMRRGLPTIDLVARAADDTLSVTGAKVDVDSWRLVAGKHLSVLGLVVGVGQDRYDAEASVSAVVREGILFRSEMATPAPFSQDLTRNNAFASLSLNFAVLHLVAEVGRSWGGDAPTVNTFAGTSAAEPRLYGSFGLRLGQ